MDPEVKKVIISPDLVPDKWKPLVIILNFIGLITWAIVTYLIMANSRSVISIASNQNAYLGIIVPTVTYGILSLVAGTALINILNPWFNFIELMKGDSTSKLAGAIIWFGTMLSIALIIMGVR